MKRKPSSKELIASLRSLRRIDTMLNGKRARKRRAKMDRLFRNLEKSNAKRSRLFSQLERKVRNNARKLARRKVQK